MKNVNDIQTRAVYFKVSVNLFFGIMYTPWTHLLNVGLYITNLCRVPTSQKKIYCFHHGQGKSGKVMENPEIRHYFQLSSWKFRGGG